MAENYYHSSLSGDEIESRLVGAVVFNATQGLTTSQKEQARQNIGAGASDTKVLIMGYFDTLEELESRYPVGNLGDAYGVGTESPYDIYIWDNVHSVWVNNGPIVLSDAVIDDEDISADTAWSSSKTNTQINAVSTAATSGINSVRNDLTTAVNAVSADLATHPRPNLLENWYFVGGGSQQGYGYFPLNSKGQTVYSSPTHNTIDRWGIEDTNGSITVNSDSVTLSTNSSGQAVFWQLADSGKAQSLLGKTVTLSVLATSGLYSSTFTIPGSLSGQFVGPVTNINQNAAFMLAFFPSSSSYQLLRFGVANNASVSLIAAKLELGSTQTLAHQENGVWVLNEVPSYGEEYAETVVSRKGIQWKLLWTNPNPTADFAQQVISLDLSEYQEVLIKMPVWSDNSDQQSMCEQGLVGSRIWPTYWQNDTVGGNAILTTRRMEVSASGVNVFPCYSKNGSSAASITNNLLVPRYIYAR